MISLNYKKFFIIIVLIHNVTYAQYLPANDNVINLKRLSWQRKNFIKVEEELKKSKNLEYNKKILDQSSYILHDYPLYPYLELIYLQQSIQKVNLAKLLDFTKNYPNTPLSKNLRETWLLYNAKYANWQEFVQAYESQNDQDNIELECYYIQAKQQMHTDLSPFALRVKQIWLHHSPQPKSCDVVFNVWKNQGFMTKAMIWQRIKLAITADKLKFAKYLSNSYLNKEENVLVDWWLKVHANPELILRQNYFKNHHPVLLEIFVYGIENIAKKDPDLAAKFWAKLSKEYNFSNRQNNSIIKKIGFGLAARGEGVAWEWLNKVSTEYRDEQLYNTQLMMALKDMQWKRVITIFEELPNAMQQQEKWLYWYARALEHNHQFLDSKKILIKLADNRSYYGFLSSSKLLKPYNFKFKPVSITASQMDAILQNKALQRAYELLQLDRPNKASKEWYVALGNMVEWELHAAAKLADSLSMPNWAIAALSDAKDQDDLSLRFPKYYSNQIMSEAHRNALDPAWVFAVTRQESAFRPYVKSYAGALGLMQVMPKTGLMVAKAINIRLRNTNDLLEINNNVKLGSKYLQLMLEKYKNLAVATAAYNAGPGRIQKWLPEQEIAADVWIETIPFKDTRYYVQNVMTYTVIYQKLLGGHNYLNLPKIKKYNS